MANLTLRNIPDEMLSKLRTLSEIERRSLNNEILVVLERGLQAEESNHHRHITTNTQLSLLTDICGKWEDSRSTKKVIEDIYFSRSKGRKVNL